MDAANSPANNRWAAQFQSLTLAHCSQFKDKEKYLTDADAANSPMIGRRCTDIYSKIPYC